MNNGKICISVCADTMSELTQRAELASFQADLVELRIDCVERTELDIAKIPIRSNYIITFRPREQGGMRDLSLDERKIFWQQVDDHCGADLEEDAIDIGLSRSFDPVISSYHDFNHLIVDICQVYERLANTRADVMKIADDSDDVLETIDIWK